MLLNEYFMINYDFICLISFLFHFNKKKLDSIQNSADPDKSGERKALPIDSCKTEKLFKCRNKMKNHFRSQSAIRLDDLTETSLEQIDALSRHLHAERFNHHRPEAAPQLHPKSMLNRRYKLHSNDLVNRDLASNEQSMVMAKARYLNRCMLGNTYNINKLLMYSKKSFDSGFYSPASTDDTATRTSGPSSQSAPFPDLTCSDESSRSFQLILHSTPKRNSFVHRSVVELNLKPSISSNFKPIDRFNFPKNSTTFVGPGFGYWSNHYRKFHSTDTLTNWK